MSDWFAGAILEILEFGLERRDGQSRVLRKQTDRKGQAEDKGSGADLQTNKHKQKKKKKKGKKKKTKDIVKLREKKNEKEGEEFQLFVFGTVVHTTASTGKRNRGTALKTLVLSSAIITMGGISSKGAGSTTRVTAVCRRSEDEKKRGEMNGGE